MDQSYSQPQDALAGFLSSMQQDTSMSAYSLFGPSEYPESVAFWHDPSATHPVALPTPSYLSARQSTLLQPIPDQKKHKRTRSGCFTCRARRIKCDESRPICERCRKGSRDCVYPSPNAPSSKAARVAAKSRSARPPSSQGSESSGKPEFDHVSPLEPIIDEDADHTETGSHLSSTSGANSYRPDLYRTQSDPSLQKRSLKQVSGSGYLSADPSSSPSTEGSRFDSVSVRSASVSHSIWDLLNSPRFSDDIRFYLNYYQDFISHNHFFLRQSSARFIHYSIVELALGYEPLLYALVGFSAYHHTLQAPGAKLYTFLKYYNRALVLLRKSLGSGEDHTEATLCTVLVLTTFEVFSCIFNVGEFEPISDRVHHLGVYRRLGESDRSSPSCPHIDA